MNRYKQTISVFTKKLLQEEPICMQFPFRPQSGHWESTKEATTNIIINV